MFQERVLAKPQTSFLEINKVLKNTYLLLSLTLLFSAGTAAFSMITQAPPVNSFITLILYFGLLFATQALRNSGWGLVTVFALTGFMGYTLGPILNFYIHGFTNGNEIVMAAFGATGIIFFSLSAYALTSKKDFSYLGAFLFVTTFTAFLMGLAAAIFHLAILSLIVSAAFVLLSSGYILFQTSLIINGGERNYIMATVSLYVALLNLFLSLLQIFAAFGGNRR